MHYPGETPRWRRYLRIIRHDASADVDDELRFHFESRIEELVVAGHGRRRRARTAVARIRRRQRRSRRARRHRRSRRAATRSRRMVLAMSSATSSYAIRSLRRTPGVALAILLTLALGIGANAAMFTLLDAIFLRPPAGVVAPDGVRRLWYAAKVSRAAGMQFTEIVGYLQFDAVRQSLGDRARIALYRLPTKTSVGLGEGATTPSELREHRTTSRSSEFALARSLYSTDEDRLESPAPVIVLSESYWQRAFDGDRSAIGQSTTMGGTKYTIIGVVANNFTGTELNASDAWAPLAFHAAGRTSRDSVVQNLRAPTDSLPSFARMPG